MVIHGGKIKEAILGDLHLFNFGEFRRTKNSFLTWSIRSGAGEWSEVSTEGFPEGGKRYFHSIVSWKNALLMFGGLGVVSASETRSKNLDDLLQLGEGLCSVFTG